MTFSHICPSCGKTYVSNLPPRDPKVPLFYSGRPWVCLWCRTGEVPA